MPRNNARPVFWVLIFCLCICPMGGLAALSIHFARWQAEQRENEWRDSRPNQPGEKTPLESSNQTG